ncbi:MAG: hypothetical protein J0I06_12335 [Planctomycetes bacterium]|nr:hypothetical protein [Planctomycetota bacterium]
MRADMGKVLVERPRLRRRGGDSRPGKGYANQLKKYFAAGNSPPSREGIKRRYTDRKHFNEHLGPLRRFLDSNVGRPWDKVYSEICKHVDRNNVVQKHILTHLFDYVVVHTILIDGEPCRGEAYAGRYGKPLRTSGYRHQWYVCPKSGLLRKSKYVPREYKHPAPPRTVRLNNKQVCVDRGGRWELIAVALLWRCNDRSPAYDSILQEQVDATVALTDAILYRDGDRYAVSRRVLSRKELLGYPIPIEWLK